MIAARKYVQGIKRYEAPLDGRRQKLRLDFNENTQGPSPLVMEAVRQLPPNAYATYPEYCGLEAAFGDVLGVAGSHVAAFNGTDAAIRAICAAYGEPGSEALIATPTFGYYAACVQQHGMQCVDVAYGADFAFPLQAFKQSLKAEPRLCFICNPNNPTGTVLDTHTVMSLARSAPATLFVIDEAYAEFSGVSVLPDAVNQPNMLVLRSLSSAFGLAALRVGVAVGHAQLLESLRCVAGPYDLNMFAVVAARAALADLPYVESYVAEVRGAAEWTAAELRRRAVRHHVGGANFMVVWPKREISEVVEALNRGGVLVRNMDDHPLLEGSFRLTVGTREQMGRFMRLFASLIEE